jgi:hypothetical protein
VARLQAAQAELAKMQAANAARSRTLQKDADELRASTTDPECRKMKMPDGGFRPAYNVQFATTTAGGVIVGVDVTNAGTDGGQMTPMLEQIEERFDARPNEVLVDGGFVKVEAIDDAERNDGVCAAEGRAEATGRRPRSVRAQEVGHGRDGRVACAHGDGGSEDDLQGACEHGRVGERADAEPRFVRCARAWPTEGADGGAVVRVGAQLWEDESSAPETSRGDCALSAGSNGIRQLKMADGP